MLLDKFLGYSLLIICIILLLDKLFISCNNPSDSKHEIITVLLFCYSMYYLFNDDKNDYKIFGDWEPSFLKK